MNPYINNQSTRGMIAFPISKPFQYSYRRGVNLDQNGLNYIQTPMNNYVLNNNYYNNDSNINSPQNIYNYN